MDNGQNPAQNQSQGQTQGQGQSSAQTASGNPAGGFQLAGQSFSPTPPPPPTPSPVPPPPPPAYNPGMPAGNQGQMGGYMPPSQGGMNYGLPQQGGYAPPGGYNPPAGYGPPPPPGYGPPPPGGYGPPPPPPPEDTTPANFQLGAKLPPVLRVKVPPHQLKFDEQYFLHLLAGSISLTKDEKRKIVESIPKLRQSQIDELIRIFEEERRKFAELSKKHTPQLESLAQKHFEEWMDLESEQEQKMKSQQDEAKAEEIRKQLGLS